MAKAITGLMAVLIASLFCARIGLAGMAKDGAVRSAAGGPGLCVFNSASGLALDGPDAFVKTIQGADVVYVGETHDQLNDHLAQLEALKTLAALRGNKVAVGFEMLNMTLQPVLDEYAAGALTQEEFLAKADWAEEWGFDFNLYKPIFDFIIQNKLRAIALNVPRKIVSKIARTGLASLTPGERAFLPETVTITGHKEYLAFLRENYDSMHAAGRVSKKAAAARPMPQFTFENYLASMCAWNEGMGSRIAGFLNSNPGWAVMTVAGNGHVMYNAAIPASVKARAEGVRQVSFYTEGAPQCPESVPSETLAQADYIWFTTHLAE